MILLYVCLLFICAVDADTLFCNSTFPFSKFLTEDFEIQWDIVEDNSVLQLKLILETESPINWIGFGLSEVGQMLGSDMITISRESESSDKFILEDRHVPWSPYKPSPFPELDKYNNWFLDCVEVDEQLFTAVVHRDLNTFDGQDREIKSGHLHSVVYAWGFTPHISYHGRNRGSNTVVFFGGVDDSAVPPLDADGEIMVTYSPRFVSKGIENQYICQSFDLGEEPRHIVQMQAMVKQSFSSVEAHNILVHSCGEDATTPYYDMHQDNPMPCGSDRDKDSGITLLGAKGCETLVFAWALGGNALTLPPAAGIRIGQGGARYIIVETHLNNPSNIRGLAAAKLGVKMQTASVLREHDAAALTIGDPSISLSATGDFDRYNSYIHHETTCSSACTSNFLGDLNVFASFLHMHKYGRQMWTTVSRFNEDSYKLLSMDYVDYRQYWDYNFQKITHTKNMVISQGDKLNTHCVYDTSNTDDVVRFGLASESEMCVHFLFVYPANHLSAGFCGLSGGGYSMCSKTIRDANLICKNNPVTDGTTDLPDSLKFGIASNLTTVMARRDLVADAALLTQAEEEDKETAQLTCQLYVFTEKHLRNVRLSVAMAITIILISFCSAFALFLYCCFERKEVSTAFETRERTEKHEFDYEMVSLDDEKNSAV